MKKIVISMASLPKLTDSIKLAIGLSIWHLYQVIIKDNPKAKYLLKTDKNSYILDDEGNVINELEFESSCEAIAEVFFEGFVVPSDIRINSISNSLCK